MFEKTTFSKIPEFTYIATEQVQEILDNFSYPTPSESLYKITGVRGSGKTMMLAKIEEELAKNDGWIIIDLNPTRDMLNQIATKLEKEGFIDKKMGSRSINLSAAVLGTGGGIGISGHESQYQDISIELEDMIERVQKKNKKVLIGIDEENG